MASIHNMIHADIQEATAGNAGSVNLYLSNHHLITIFPDTDGKSHHALVDAINDAIAANTEPPTPPHR